MRNVDIYTDGGCSPNPGAGSWGVVLIDCLTDTTKELSGYHPDTTNNEMELQAAIEGFKALKRPCNVRLFTDSQWLIGAMTGNKRKRHSVLLALLDTLIKDHVIEWVWVAGHTGNQWNERCHRLVTQARNQVPHS